MEREENGRKMPTHRRVEDHRFSHRYIYDDQANTSQPRLIGKIFHIKFSRLRLLELTSVQVTSMEQLSRVEAPALEELMIGKNTLIEVSTGLTASEKPGSFTGRTWEFSGSITLILSRQEQDKRVASPQSDIAQEHEDAGDRWFPLCPMQRCQAHLQGRNYLLVTSV